MTPHKLLACFVLFTFFFIGSAGAAAADDYFADDEFILTDDELIITDEEALFPDEEAIFPNDESTQPDPVTELLTPEEPASQEVPKDCCFTKGVPECGGACDICCTAPQHAICVAGACNSNDPFSCTCTKTTSCTCD